MSRIGKQPIELPPGVTVTLEGRRVTVKGPKGELSREVHESLTLAVEDGQLRLGRVDDLPASRSLHGLWRALLANMVTGVTTGHSRTLLLTGIGFRAEQVGQLVSLNAGFSHPVLIAPDEGVQVTVEGQNRIVVSGLDKERVGDMAARIRAVRPVKPYIFRGDFQGLRYADERPRRKAGKQGA